MYSDKDRRREDAVVGYGAVVLGMLLLGGLGRYLLGAKRRAADLGPVSGEWLKQHVYREGKRGK